MKAIITAIISFLALVSYSQPSQQWLTRYNGKGDFSDKFNAVKSDAANNIFLAGSTYNKSNEEDILVIKLNSLGDTAWVRTFNGSANNTDEAFDVATDGTGNVYITGVCKNVGTGKDFATIKYNAFGDTLWTRTLNGIGNGDDEASSIYIDGSGNVYVTGKSDGNPTALINNDYVTVKYNSAGVQQWVLRFNGSGNGSDIPAGIIGDPSGNVYVTGRSANTLDDDYATIKYNSAGLLQWTKIYDGGNGTDRAVAIGIDNADNIIVTGRSSGASDDDYATIKYSSAGVQQWLKYFDGGLGDDRATALAVDSSGNIFVTGKSSNGSNDNYATVKYDGLGTSGWVAIWAGTGNGNDVANAIEVDGSGNVYVAGQTDVDATALVNNNYSAVKYNSSGAQVWNQLYNGTANLSDVPTRLAIDAAGNVVVAGNSQGLGSQKDGVAIKYNVSGVSQWTYRYIGKGDNSDKGNAITVDAGGNSYVAGSTYGAGSGKDYCTIKLNAAGDTLWVRSYNGIGNGNDEASSIAVDAAGNVFVTGYSKGAQKDYLTIKYNPSGDTVWTKRFNGAGNGDDQAIDLKLDGAGNVFVTGFTDSDNTISVNENYTTIKYSASGTQLWQANYNGAGNLTDIPAGLTIDGSGNVFVTGKSNNGSDDDYATVKYNSLGVQQWIQRYDGGQGDDRAAAIKVDAASNVYITGRTFNGSDDDYATIKYNSLGVQQWLKLYDGLLGDDRAIDLAADGSGNVYVTGKSSFGAADDILTVKYDGSGIQQWVANYDGGTNGNDAPAKILIDGAGNVLVAGQSDIGTALIPNNDYTILKYNSSGIQLWAISYNGTGNGSDVIGGIAIDNADKVYVTGTGFSSVGQKDIVTIKYSSPVGINELSLNKFQMIAYPNPFNTQCTISVFAPNTIESWTLNVYNATGEKVIVRKIDNSNQGIIKKNDLSNGVYFFQAITNTEIIGSGNFIIED
ncbi:MAG: hypothetical protein JWO44_217 [Bacteroidetes bacterium]|nr:hypothetical protein [Bacteroidota bacterium]